MRKKNRKPMFRKIALRLPDLDHAKNAVLNSLNSPNSRRNYEFAMEQFITWYCSEPRLALNGAVVLRFRLYLESLGLAAGTIDQCDPGIGCWVTTKTGPMRARAGRLFILISNLTTVRSK
jgi:hypothetical protein